MAINVELIKKKLNSFQTSKTGTSNDIWKLQPGKHTIRIVPYKYCKDNPFIEVFMHYGYGNRSYVSPKTYGNPDPMIEFADKLRLTGDKEDYKVSWKLQPKLRTYVPIIIRGEEAAGCKFWGFSQTIYTELLNYIADPDYGDITDPMNGRDIVVTVQSAEETGKQFSTITFKVKPAQSPITDSKEVLEKIFASQKKIEELFPESSYEELKIALEKWSNPEEEVIDEIQPVEENEKKSAVSKAKKSTGKVETKVESVDSIEDAFDELFNGSN